MLFPKREGADSVIPIGIDDEYEIIKILHKSAATAVYLVNYKKIGDIRVLKSINKNSPDSNSILSEAHLLKGFKSSHIPTIYSVGETADIYYLVEEYVEGQTLHEYLLENKIDKSELLKIAIEICDIIEMLHTAGSEPVLYRDMKPEHVIMQQDGIKLIDFGISVKKSMAGQYASFGSKSFAAPEQFDGADLDERCDVYGIGKVVEFMLENSLVKDDYKIKAIINRAIDRKRTSRYSTVDEFSERLREELSKQNEKFEGRHLKKQIAIIGTDKSVGCTHIAIKLCSYLNKKGINSYYRDEAGDKTVIKLRDNLKQVRYKEGVLYHKNFRGIIEYGPAVASYKPPDGVYIHDYGKTDIMPEADVILLITSSSPWKNVDNFPDWARDVGVLVINNFATKSRTIEIAKILQKRIYVFPESKAIFDCSRLEEKLMSALLSVIKGQ